MPAWHGQGTKDKAWRQSLSGYGARLMGRMGWEAGEGLGAQGQGRAACVEAQAPEGALGVGARDAGDGAAGEAAWWERAFNKAATKKGKKGKKEKEKRKGKRGGEGDEAREGPAKHRDGVGTTATEDEMAIAARLAADPWGRFGRCGAKLARIREQEQSALAAGAGQELAEAETVGPASLHDGTRVEEGVGANRKRKSSASGPEAPASPLKRARKRIVVELPGDAISAEKAESFVPTLLKGWWGARWFAAGGLLEGLSEKTKTFEQGFKMEDQEKLYMRAQFQRNRGGTGLGSSGQDLPKANLGKDWAGSKKTDFGELGQNGVGGAGASTSLPDAAVLTEECAKTLSSAKKGKLKLPKLEAKVFKKLAVEASAARSAAFKAFVQGHASLRLKKGKVAQVTES